MTQEQEEGLGGGGEDIMDYLAGVAIGESAETLSVLPLQIHSVLSLPTLVPLLLSHNCSLADKSLTTLALSNTFFFISHSFYVALPRQMKLNKLEKMA